MKVFVGAISSYASVVVRPPPHQQHRYGGRHSSGSATAGTGRGKASGQQRQQTVQ